MRTLAGESPYTTDNQSVILQMYRAWLFILSIGIVLPLRWLPHLFSKPSKLALPLATTAVMVTCGELLLNNPTITPAGPYCPGDQITITFTGANLPDGENLDVFIGNTNSYNPFLGGGTQIGSIPIDYNCSSPCPTLLGMMANPCGTDSDNEYVLLSSGCGFNVSDLWFDLDPLNNTGTGNADPGSPTCPFGTPDATLISSLQTGNCATLIIPAGPGDNIPGGANVIIFTDSGTPANIPNLDDLCATGQPVYILQNSCMRTSAAISNNGTAANPTRTYTIYTNGSCPDAISFGYDPSYTPQNSEWRLEDGTLIQSSGCDAPFDMVNYPAIPNNLVSLNYTIPSNICGSSSGNVNFYISGMVDLTGPCADIIYTPPSSGSMVVACPAIIDPAGPFCANDAPVNLTASNMPGGTWSGTGITNSTLGTFDPTVAGPGSHIITYTVGCPTPSTATIVVYDAVTIDPGSVILDNDVPCLGGTGDAVFFGSYSGGSGNYFFDWDDSDTPGNDVFADDGNISITGLTEGNYYFIVSDDNGCADTLAFDIAVFTPPTISATIDPINCFGGTTGPGFGINITVSGGPGGVLYYDWNLDGGANEDFGGPPAVDEDAEDIYNLVAGTYYLTVTITDEFSYWCDYLDTFVITQPTQLTVNAPDIALPCFGNTATLSATPAGGTPGYTYDWGHISGSNNPPPWAPVGAGTYNLIVRDANGCSVSDVVVVTQPSAALMASATGETIPCNDGSGDINLTVTGGTPIYTFLWSPGGSTAEDPSGLNAGTYTVTVTDANGCTTTAQATIVLQDIIPPGITCPPNVTLACNAAVPAPNPGSVTATDACGAPVVTHGGDATSTVGCVETTTRTYIATDVNGNTASCTHTITRTVDPTPPSITCPVNVTLSCNAAVPGPNIGAVTASDGCGNVVVTHSGDATSTVGCVETTTRTYLATDDCGNTATCTQTITRTVDTTPPAFSGIPGPTTIECTGTPTFVTPTVTDACGAPVVTFMDVTTNGSCPNEFSVTRTWTATDACGNMATATQTINVDDTTPPVISGIPGTSTIECSGTPAWGNPTATDNCSTPTLNFVDATMAGSCPDAYTLTRTWTATDACGNTATGVQTINVNDTTPPVISGLPGASSIECSGTPNWVTPTVTDNCSTPVVVFADVTTNGSCPNEYTITRTWTATDDCGNTATATQVYNVDDTTPPVISGVPGPSSMECDGTPAWGNPTATDNCATPTLTFVDATMAGSCPGSYTLTRTWTANDGCGNTATAVQTITVDDTTPPVISGLPGPSMIECSATPNWVTPTATDNCGTPTLNFVDATMAGSCPDAYTITRTWTADDGCGNTATAVQTITVDDTTPPVISGLPGPSMIECSGTPNWVTPTATDNCASPALNFVDATMAGSCPDAYTITRTWTATDDCGNTATAVQTITVDDTTPPVISGLPGPTTIECSGTPNWVTPTATDNCDTPTLTFADVTTNGSCPNEYTITRTWTATDDCGNTATATQVFTIDDTTPPVISGLPGPSTIECSGTPNFATATATDNCTTPTLTFADVTTNGSCPNEYTITRTWTADDGCGNTATATQVINVDDTMPPIISGVPGPSSMECDGTPAWGNPTATDNCATPTLTFVDATMSGSCPGSYTLTRTWTANDGCGNTATAVQTITVDDTTPPVISGLPGPSMIECSGTPNWVTPTATDNCGTPTLTFVDATMAGSCPDAYTITRTWTADDGCGNTATAVQTITVDDTTPPVISGLPGPSMIECSGTPNWVTPTATDNCAIPTLNFVDATMAGSCPDAYTITRTWTATDDCGNTATAVQTITVDDTTPPVISGLPGPSTAECSGTPNWVTPTATDNCGIPSLTFADVTTNGSCPNEYTITRTWTATDDCGNTATASQVFTIDDTTPPVISGLPGPSTIECSGTPNFATATATDNCSTPTLTFTDVTTNGSCPNEFTITRTWTADDGCGNTATATQVINVDDTMPPTISGVPGPSSMECDGTPAWGNPTATDNCATPTLTFVDATMSGSCPGSYTLTRTWTADDGCGNTATAVQTITVDDTTPPVISGLPGPSMIECSATPNWATPTATDNCGTPTLSFVDATMAGSCPDAYTITRTWTADDGCGNTATAVQTITVDDTTPPVISGLPGPSMIECSATPNWVTPTATDNCSTPTLTFVDATMAGSCPDAYTITRTWTATDDCGNTATADQTITVDDTTPPVISGLPGPSIVECSGTPNWVTPTATDNCGTPVLTFADVTTNGSCPNEYTITRTWTATDDCGNTATASQVFTIDDTTPPVISGLPGPSTIECDGTPNFATPTATDNCSTPTLTFADVTTNGSCPNEYTITRTWTADDGCGNTATATQVINVDDTMPPTISGVPGPSSIECDGTPAWGNPVATDNCSTPTLTFVDATVAGPCPGSYTLTRTWTADDGCGNTATEVQTITVDDTTPPVISGLPGPSMIECSDPPNWVTPTATDNCGTPTLTFVDATMAGSCPDAYTITRTWTADDGCGNTATAVQTITVDDTTPPVISGLPGPSMIECSATPNWVTPTATDNCSTPALTFVDATMSGSCPDAYTITRTWTATDDCGNTTTADQTITVDDTTPPVISGLPGPSTVECSGTPNWVTPTATDNCGTPVLTFADVTTSGSCPNEYTITRTWTATDDCGNSATAAQVFTIDDTTPPVISGLPGPSTIECDGTPSFATPTATDNCGTPTLTFADVTTNGACPNEYTITRTWTADDGCGNTAVASQVITVDDTTPPVISGLPGPTNIECSDVPVWDVPTATDNCATPTLTFVDATVAGPCPGSYTLTRTWTADDGCGNTTTAVQTINVDDTTPPVISGLPGPSMIECSATPNWVTPTATDNCGTPALTFVDATMAGSCPDAYTITRTWTADDGCGNTATAVQTITVDDTTPPVISSLPGPSTVECSGMPNWVTPTATDNCSTPILTFADVTTNGSCPNEYTITRTWTATDDCGNTATASQEFTVDDTTPPVISGLPGPSTLECSGTPNWVTPTVTDNCGTPAVTFADVTTNGSCPNEYTITRTWTADDGCGNIATASQVINIDDTMPPVISGLPGPSTIECDGTPNFATPTATDNCNTPTLTFADVTTNGSCPNEYTITRTWTADDGCGNTATASQVINVDDTTPPVISGLSGPTNIECSDVPTWDVPTATDNCATPTLTFVDATISGSCPGSYTLTRTWTADDGCGNTATAVQTINVDDTTPPVISGLPGPSSIECSDTPNWVTPTATDNCGTPALTFVDATMAGSCPDAYTITRTWTADDGCGNTATAVQTINVDDTTPPVISGLPGPSTVECSGTPSWVTPTATDNCAVPGLTFADVTTNGSCPNEYTITRTWTATDDCGNTATASQEFTVDDTTPPVISGLPGPSTIECSGTPNWVTPTVTDNCSTPSVTFADVTTNGSCPNEYTITRTWTADDGCGNTATASQVINVDDTTPPVISGLPGPSTIECDGTPNFATPTATDNCSTPTLTFADVTTNGSCPNEYTITRTWTADDGCGNTATASQVINVDDTTPPVISGLPGPTNIECSGTPSWDVPTATDNCGTPTLTFTDATIAGPCPGSYTVTRTWTADDGCGNTSTAEQIINVEDTTPPVISGLPGPSTIECDASPNFATPTATDDCGTPTLTFADVTTNGSCPNEYTITRTWTADDGCGNTATASQVINVDDTTPPVISGLPGPSTVECSGTPSWVTPTATDNCAVPALTFADVTTNGSCPNEYTITRTWTATDDCGNTATASQEFTVDDTTPPVISGLPGPSTIECSGTPNWVTPTVTDNCSTPSVTFADVTTNGSCPNEYTITRTWTADDGCGNTATASQVFNVDDTTPPVISGLPGPSTIECDGTPNFATPTATDNCSTPTLTFADVTTNGSCPNEYTITRTWTADDGCGNTATASQVINVDDTTPPVISGLPGPTNIECSGTPSWDVPTATDNCGTPTLTFTDATIAGPCPGSYTVTRTWTADDGCGNTSTAEQIINVEDTTPPVISGLPGPSTIECDASPNFATPTATDDCGTPTLTFADVTTNGSCPNEYTITRTWTADDGCGNTATASQVINVDDTTPPVISGLPGPSTVECSGMPNWVTPTATDNCSTPSLTFADVTINGSCPNEYTITRTWTATDDCGNTATASQEFNVDDTTPPTATSPASVTVECVGDVPAPDPTVITDEADNCPGMVTVAFVSDMSSGGPCPEVITRTYIVTDACGNTILVTQSITIDDTTPPTASSPAPVDVDCVANIPAPDPNIITDEADNCPGVLTVDFVGDVSDGGLCPETITRTYSVTDACGNITLVNQTITVDDDIAPTASNLPPIDVTCIGDVPAPDPNLVTDEADNCPGTIAVAFFGDISDGGSCPETITRSYSVTDACGNQILVTQVITVNDDIPPTASDPAAINVDCAGSVPVPDPAVVTDEADNCPGTIIVAFVDDMSDGGTCPETVTRTYSVTDACGNSILVTQMITVGDIIPPTASDPAPLSVDCIEDVPAPDVNVVTDEADNCSGALIVAFESESSDGGSCPETITRIYSVTDDCGNSIQVTHIITVDDNIPPTATAPAPLDVDCLGDVPAPDPNAITDEADNCTAPVIVAFVGDVPDGASCPLTITRTYSITDGCGNQILVDQIISVNDDTPPTASNPSSEVLSGCNMPIPAPDISVVLDAADNCGTPVVAFVGDVTDLVGCTETTTRTFSVTDACNNSITVEQLIIRTVDMTPPVFANPPVDITVNCIAQVPPMVDLDYTDNCSPSGTVVGTETGPSGNPLTIIREWTVTDDCGNATSVMQTITILEVPSETDLVDAICEGEVYILPDGSSTSVTGMYGPYVFMDINGCDSVVNVDLTVYPPTSGIEDYSGCEGDGYSVTVNGTVYDENNPTGSEVLTDINGCDSTVTINLVFNLLTSGTETYSGCEGDGYAVTVNGTVYDENNPDGIEILPGSNGCDSTVTIDLDFAPTSMGSETYTGCSGDGYSVTVNGTVYDENNPDGTETLIGINGCDSIVDIDLTFHPLQTGSETYNGCEGDGYSVVVNGTIYDESNPNGVETLTDINGCDSVVTIDLDFSPELTGTETYSGCEGDGYSVIVNGTVYNEGNPTGMETLNSSIGCDSIVTIILTFSDTTSGVETYSGCEGDGYSVTVNGTVYNELNPNGVETLPGSNGCDSIVTITLTFAPAGNGTETYSGCSGDGYSVTVNGTIYDESNPDGVETFPGGNGCDSTVIIDLDFAPLGMGMETYSGCEGDGYSVVVNGTVYDESNQDGTETFPGPNGCDSTVVIDLEFSPELTGEETYSGCEGDGYSVVVNGTVYDESNPTGVETIPGAGCDSVVTIDLFFAQVIPAIIDPAGPLCTTAGAITLTASPPGGTWSGAVSNNQFDPSAFGVGTYEVIYTVTGSCTTADTIDIVVYELTLSCSTLQNESETGAADGEAQVSVSGGVPPYDITWTGPVNGSVTLPADGSFTITNLPGGVYNVEVVDATGCIAECEFTITSPVPCELFIDGVTIQDASCPGVNNGSIIINASTNMPPIEYSIDGGAFGSNNVFSMLAPGPHTVTVRDAAGCLVEQIIDVGVGQGPELTLVEVVDATCGQANGSIEVEATGGATPYNYSIDGITYGLSPLFPGLNAGNFNIYMIDDGGCTDTIPVTVNATNAPIITSIDITQSSCGQADGSLTINATGGLGVLMYSINGGNPQPSPVFNGLMAGTYSILVEDEAGCQVTGSATITDQGGPTIDNVVIVPTSCGTFDGTITVEATGTGLQYQLNNDPFQNSNFFDNLPAGNYILTVRDGNGCIVSQPVTVNTTNGPQIQNVIVMDTECGLDNGSIEVIATGGTGELIYCIDGDCGDESIFTDLEPGTYVLTVEDENSCTAEETVTILSSIGPEFDVYITAAHCGLADGIVELDATGGTPPFQYSFNGGPFGASFTFVNKVSDFYTVAVRDANGCIVEEEIFLWEEDPPSIENIVITDPDCGLTNGMIFIDADSSGNLMYSIQLPFFQEGPTFTNVPPGTYTITVEDEWGCDDTGTAVINANPNPVLTLDTVSTACGESIGVITATATGGIPPYQYSINNGPFTSNNVFSGLAAGTYTVVVRGNNGCEDSETIDIISVGTQFGDLVTSICEGDTLFLHGEEFTTTGNYQVDVPGGATNGCDSIVNLELGIDPLNDVIIAQSICAGDTFTYNGIDYTVAGQYVIDTLTSTTGGCDTIVTIDLSVLPLLNTYLDVTICDGGVFTINGMDYTMAGNYVIDTLQSGTGCDSIRTLRLAVQDYNQTTIIASICEGDTYTINGMDYTMTGIYNVDTLDGPNSCDTILILDLTVSPLPAANAGADMTIDCEVQSVTLNGSASGGNILWTGPDINPGNETDLMPVVTQPGVYILTVTSSQSCIAVDTVIVNLDPEAVVADAGPDAFFSCDIDTIVLQASPVGPNYTYQWTGPGINASNENLPNPIVTEPGTYTLVVTDQVSQCVSLPDEVFIDDITVVIIAIIQDPSTLNCFTTSVDLVSTGSSTGPDIVYTWFDQEGNLISTSPGFPVSSGGMFTLIVEDTISGCFDDDSVMVQDLTEYPAVDAGPDHVIDCNHPTVILNEGAVNTNPNLVFEWTGPAGGIIGPIDEITAVAGLAGDYILTAIDINNGCENDDTVSVTNLISLPLADINIAQTITCIDSIALLDIGGSTLGQDVVYTWSGPGVNNVMADSIETALPGTYFLDVEIASTGCSARDTVVLVLPLLPSDLVAVAEIPICEGDTSGSLMITGVTGGSPVYMYSLDGGPFQTSPVFDNLMAGTYDIAVVDANGCEYNEGFTIADGIPLTIDIGPDIELELGDSVILWADVSLPWSQIDSIVWTPLDILSCEYCTNPTLYGLNDAVVTATVYTGGCVDQDMLNLRVDVDANIYIPNVFSPNGDGINDHVTVFTDHRVRRVVYLEIFDRWGNQVFVGTDFAPNDPLLGWDGSFRGKLMNPAVFAYIARVELINGAEVDRKGDITIVR